MQAELALSILTILLLGFLLVAVFFDMTSGLLSDLCTAAIAILALCIAFLSHSLLSSFLGAAVSFGIFGSQWILSRGRAIGSGDIFLASALGLWLGLRGTIIMIFSAYAIGAIVVGALLLSTFISLKQKQIPFGPFLGLGALLSYFFGSPMAMYLQ
ncbi:hypothetical protein EXS65_02725 [Candidatus Peribacteria bacterium]|nr:hypothetical protein [Candidatus Peribacteria bacterium]